MTRGRCRNPYCHDISYGAFCPSCRWIGKWAFAAGSFVVGAVVALIKFIS